MAYLFTYVFPFLGLSLGDRSSVIGFVVFFLVLLIISVSSALIHINPTLNLLGYHVYAIDTAEAQTQTVISKRARLIRGSVLHATMIGDDLYLESR